MKKITLLAFLLLSAIIKAQTYAIYTEDTSIGAGLTHLRFSNGQAFSLSEPTTAPYEGTQNYLLTYNGSSSYFHAIFLPRNSSNTSDVTIDLSAYSYYNISLKTSSPTPFYLRMRGNGITAKVLIDPASNSYGFTNDNQWHFMSIPFADFIPESASFSLALITEVLVLRSNVTGTIVGTVNDFEFDNVYASVSEVLSNKTYSLQNFTVYPNPTQGQFNITTNEELTVVIYDMVGKIILNQKSIKGTHHFDISNFSNGLYLITLTKNKEKQTYKLLKN
ncbi:T9SS type A sorting domain-containing protein [Flavobacterium sp. J27]|uniref:T9SS type A sorting domain-containing protein n=1 Tax=Flavobacterium sp. J27 TaxID=2060419 RepID=UPI0010314401|nr:T9SS type A sorting domain-containing protein [Flavobacterium sp. J27]